MPYAAQTNLLITRHVRYTKRSGLDNKLHVVAITQELQGLLSAEHKGRSAQRPLGSSCFFCYVIS